MIFLLFSTNFCYQSLPWFGRGRIRDWREHTNSGVPSSESVTTRRIETDQSTPRDFRGFLPVRISLSSFPRFRRIIPYVGQISRCSTSPVRSDYFYGFSFVSAILFRPSDACELHELD